MKVIGATAHYVTEQLDEGPIIEQQVINVDHSQLPGHLAPRRAESVERLTLPEHCASDSKTASFSTATERLFLIEPRQSSLCTGSHRRAIRFRGRLEFASQSLEPLRTGTTAAGTIDGR